HSRRQLRRDRPLSPGSAPSRELPRRREAARRRRGVRWCRSHLSPESWLSSRASGRVDTPGRPDWLKPTRELLLPAGLQEGGPPRGPAPWQLLWRERGGGGAATRDL